MAYVIVIVITMFATNMYNIRKYWRLRRSTYGSCVHCTCRITVLGGKGSAFEVIRQHQLRDHLGITPPP